MIRSERVTLREAALILGCSVSTVRRHIAHGRLPPASPYRHRTQTRADVERLALTVYRWRRFTRSTDSYWVTGDQAARVLGVNETRLNQLAARGALPYETHASGTRLYRRDQLAVVGNARAARRDSLTRSL